jgi:hypothetical protein
VRQAAHNFFQQITISCFFSVYAKVGLGDQALMVVLREVMGGNQPKAAELIGVS